MKTKKTVTNVSAAYMLRLIVKFLNRNDQESENLWYVLAALRGPDKDDYCSTIKMSTTARIRGAIGLKPWSDCLVSEGPISTLTNTQSKINGDHFSQHIEQAKRALHNMGVI